MRGTCTCTCGGGQTGDGPSGGSRPCSSAQQAVAGVQQQPGLGAQSSASSEEESLLHPWAAGVLQSRVILAVLPIHAGEESVCL